MTARTPGGALRSWSRWAVACVAAVALLADCGSGPRGPGLPTHAVADAWTSFAYVHWDAPPHPGSSPIIAYRIISRPGHVIADVPATQTWGEVPGLESGSSYTFGVSAIDAQGRLSGLSRQSNVVTLGAPVIHVVGNDFVDADGNSVQLVGVDRSGTEYSCVIDGPVGGGIFSGPSDAVSIAVMASWRINAVRIPLNEDCWLGINGANPRYSGNAYRAAILAFVQRLNHVGLVAILDLHWNAPGALLATGQQMMADADHSQALWTSVATTFVQMPGVVFDLYNEPRKISWACWRSGCQTPEGWRAAGMQSLIDAVRATGATQPIIVSGLNYGNDLSGWLSAGLQDPLHQLVAGLHMYNNNEAGYCNSPSCWNATIAPVAAKVPVMTTELAEFDHQSTFVTGYMTWAAGQAGFGRNISFAAWSWDAALGEGGPSLIKDFNGTPTRFGGGVRSNFASMWSQGVIGQG